MKCLLLGYGEIGKAVKEVYGGYHDIEVIDPKYPEFKRSGSYDILLVAIPYSDGFCYTVSAYQTAFKVKATIVFSTVQVGTCSSLKNCVHSPVEGKHPDLANSIRTMQRVVGGVSCIALDFFWQAGQMLRLYKTPEITEALKLLSTTFYGVCLEYYRYAASVLQEVDGTGNEFKDFTYLYNLLYEKMDMPQFRRPLLDFPKNEIGGHCVVPNAKILMELFPFSMVEEVATQREGKK